MKRLLILLLFISVELFIYCQTEGISYQAVILDPNTQELPGVDAEGNILPNTEISIRFTIIDANNYEEYQEIQTTQTDEYGMVNLLIGEANPDEFAKVNWDGTDKTLNVEIDFNGTGAEYVSMGRQHLTFVPYAYHRNITAHGTLVVDDVADLNSELRVHGPASINSSLDVNNENPTNLTGTLQVSGSTNLNNTLSVAGNTDLDNRLIVTGKTNLNDTLVVSNWSPAEFTGKIHVSDTARFDGSTEFNAPSAFTEIAVEGQSSLNGLTIANGHTLYEDSVKIEGQLKINANIPDGSEDTINHYPLIVEGGTQGIAIKVNGIDNDNPSSPFIDVPMSTANNFISFWDADENNMWGRIEAQSVKDMNLDPEYAIEHGVRIADIVANTAEVVSAIAELVIDATEVAVTIADVRACVGLGACVTAPPPAKIATKIAKVVKTTADIVANTLNMAMAITEEVSFVYFSESQVGVSYQSGAGDYAEWLPKENPEEKFIAGEIVGIKNGLVSKNIFGVEKVMVVSTNPIVLGNMPQDNNKNGYEKIAFMGQVPVRILGNVQTGDYVLPNELAPGFGKAVHPDNMTARDYRKIVGVVWGITHDMGGDISIANVAVGINTNDVSDIVAQQEEKLNTLLNEYNQLKSQIDKSNAALAELLPGYAESIGFDANNVASDYNNNSGSLKPYNPGNNLPCTDCPDEKEVIIIEFTKEQMELGFDIAWEEHVQMVNDMKEIGKLMEISQTGAKVSTSAEKGQLADIDKAMKVSLEEHPFWKRINSDPHYKEEIMLYLKSSIEKRVQEQNDDDDAVQYEIKFTGF